MEIDDPIYLVPLIKVSRRFRQLLGGEEAKVFWQFRLKNDFPKAYAEGIDAKEAYKGQWQTRKNANTFHRFHSDLFNSIRKGNLAKIRSENYCRGNRGPFEELLNDFMHVANMFEESALTLASKYDRKEIQRFNKLTATV